MTQELALFLIFSPKGAHYALFTPDVCHADTTAKYSQCSIAHSRYDAEILCYYRERSMFS